MFGFRGVVYVKNVVSKRWQRSAVGGTNPTSFRVAEVRVQVLICVGHSKLGSEYFHFLPPRAWV